ncbi:hypothetical protein WD019_16005 [Fictibacillus sp. Mic-4]|uniref:hypothetical protein n=1 Tax=Fictibacillus sp. Mic-4 TaxID=3132826 RepID=UPI003CE759A5
MEKRQGIEGSAASRMIQLIRKHGYNRDITIEIGTVATTLPNLSINIDGVTLDMDDLILSATAEERRLQPGDTVIVIGDDDTQFYYVIDKAVV